MRACILEWILMDPRRSAEFIERISTEFEIRSRFAGYYTSVVTVMGRLGAPEPETPAFIAEKLERLLDALKSEEKWLELAGRKLTVRATRTYI